MRLVWPENWHLTVLFFPDLNEEERAEAWTFLEPMAGKGGWGDLAFNWQGLSLWPAPRRPSLIALEAEPYLPAQTWPIAPLLTREPFSKGETRHFSPFRPHITVMRFDPRWRKTIAEDWAQVTRNLGPLDPARLRFMELSFVLSVLTPEEPVYVRERRVGLGDR
jgi:2'-5' RNA ligase